MITTFCRILSTVVVRLGVSDRGESVSMRCLCMIITECQKSLEFFKRLQLFLGHWGVVAWIFLREYKLSVTEK